MCREPSLAVANGRALRERACLCGYSATPALRPCGGRAVRLHS